MVESTQTIQAAEAIRSLIATGLGEKEIHELVTAVSTESRPGQDIEEGGLEVFDHIPEGMIDLPTASRRYRRSIGTLHTWLTRRRIRPSGRLRSSARGGGKYLVRIADIEAVNTETPRRNRSILE